MKSNEVHDIFISYRREGGETLAMLLYERLTHAGYRVFLDVESLKSGKFNEALLEKIRTCTDMLVLLPPKALDRCVNEDDWVRLEIECAIENDKNIVPIMMRGFEWPKELPESIADLPNFNGVTANSTELFDGVLLRLQTKLLHSKPHEKRTEGNPKFQPKQKNVKKKAIRAIYELISGISYSITECAGLVLLAVADSSIYLRVFYPEKLAENTGILFEIFNDTSLTTAWIIWLFLSILGIYFARLGMKGLIYLKYTYIQKDDIYSIYCETYSKNNIDYTDFLLPFDEFQNRLFNSCDKSIILEPSISDGTVTKYSSIIKGCTTSVFRNDNQNSIDCFHVAFSQKAGTLFSVLFIEAGMPTKTAVILLTKQGFECVEKRKELYLFEKENCRVLLRVCFDTVQELEVCQNGYNGVLDNNTNKHSRPKWSAYRKKNYPVHLAHTIICFLIQLLIVINIYLRFVAITK